MGADRRFGRRPPRRKAQRFRATPVPTAPALPGGVARRARERLRAPGEAASRATPETTAEALPARDGGAPLQGIAGVSGHLSAGFGHSSRAAFAGREVRLAVAGREVRRAAAESSRIAGRAGRRWRLPPCRERSQGEIPAPNLKEHDHEHNEPALPRDALLRPGAGLPRRAPRAAFLRRSAASRIADPRSADRVRRMELSTPAPLVFCCGLPKRRFTASKLAARLDIGGA